MTDITNLKIKQAIEKQKDLNNTIMLIDLDFELMTKLRTEKVQEVQIISNEIERLKHEEKE